MSEIMGLIKRSKNYTLVLQRDLGRGPERIQLSTHCSDRRAAQEVERKVLGLIDARLAGQALPAGLREWVGRMPAKLREGLVRHGVLDAEDACAAQSLIQHVEDYLAAGRHAGHAAEHLENKRRQLHRLVDHIRGRRLDDLNLQDVECCLAALKQKGLSHRTVNHHLATAKAFVHWCVRQGRLQRDVLEGASRLPESHDRRRQRRAFTEDELQRLLATAPADRRVVYLVAGFTGLRRRELRELQVRDVDLGRGVLTVRSEVAKTRQADALPLHPAVVVAMQAHIPAAAQHRDRVFASIPTPLTLRRDLERAGIQPVDDQGRRLDLHAMRATFATQLIRQGTPLPVVQRLTRHRTVSVLLNRYALLDQTDAERAVRQLPMPAARAAC